MGFLPEVPARPGRSEQPEIFMNLLRPSLVSILFLLVVAPPTIAQVRATVTAAAAGEIEIDGVLDEPAWLTAEAATDFLQFEPSEGQPASQRTEVRVLYGPGHLFIGATLHDTAPELIEPTLGRRDDFNRADWFIVSIDSYLDRRNAYAFGVNAAGVQYDAVQGDAAGGGGGPGGGGGGPNPSGMDPSWDAIWTSDVTRTAEGWTVEMAIPYSMLRFRRGAAQTWGVQFSRHLPRSGEISEWPLVRRVERTNQVALFADLIGIQGIAPRRNLQFSPYTLAGVHAYEREDRPGSRTGEGEFEVGADLKVGLGSNVTLDVTLNPDFGQVESDPAVLNLTAFETVFDEKRPFFLEGSHIYSFETGPGSLLYTRRIGAEAPIIGAAKVSGRTAGGLSFGALAATTGHDLDPDRHFGVVRATQQFAGNSTLGAILTATDGPVSDEARRSSIASGLDWELRMLNDRYSINGFAASTHRRWSEGAGENDNGFAGQIQAEKREGAWQGFVGADVFSDDFDPNDLGELRERNAYVLLSSIDHDINGGQPFGPFQRASADLFAIQKYTYTDGRNQGMELELGSRWMLRSFQAIELGVAFERPFGGYDPYETRGLWPWASPSIFSVEAEFTTDERRSWMIEPDMELQFQEGGGRGYATGLRGNWRVSDRVTLEGNIEGEWERNVLSWSANETFRPDADGLWSIRHGEAPDGEEGWVEFDDGGVLDGLFGGGGVDPASRYQLPIFGRRDTRSVDVTLRGSYTFTPDLSFQLYGQLFAAGGRYDQMGILADPDRLVDFDAFPKREDFSFSSLQSNAVLRWEYRPGSTLYVVWTHGRQNREEMNPLAPWGPSPYGRPLGRQLGDTFDIVPQDVLQVKLSYTFLN